MTKGKTPINQLSGCRQRRKAHHHTTPMSAAMIPKKIVGPRLFVWPDKPSARSACPVERDRPDPGGGGFVMPILELFDTSSLALITMRFSAEAFGWHAVSVSCASGGLSTTHTSVGLTMSCWVIL